MAHFCSELCKSLRGPSTNFDSLVVNVTCLRCWKDYLFQGQNALSSMYISKTFLICRLNYLHIDEVFIQQIKELSADRKAICGLKNYLQIKELCVDQSSICESKKYCIFISKNYLQVKKLPADRRIICRLENYLQIEDLHIEKWFAD